MIFKDKPSDTAMEAYRRAARLHASVNRSDPFAYSRALCHMVNGIAFVADVVSDAKQRGAQ